MRRWSSIALATALEMLSEPLSFLVLLSSLAIAVFAPAFHYHQFGEASRMARDSGLSALFVGGSVFAIFGTIRAFRREVESCTMEMILAHPVSRGGFFASKLVGVGIACLAFSATLLATTMVMVAGAEVGGAIAERTGDIARIYGPFFAAGVGIILLSLVVAAGLNRFAEFRWTFSAMVLALVLSIALAIGTGFLTGWCARRVVPVAVLCGLPMLVLASFAAAFSLRFRTNVAAVCSVGVFAVLLPAIGNYNLSNALSDGGVVPWSYVALAALVAVPMFLLALLLGLNFIHGRDL